MGRLHQDIRDAEKEDFPDAPGVELQGGRAPEAPSHHDQGGHNLARHRGDGRSRDAKLRQSEHAEDQQRVEDDIGQGPGDLGQHRRPHVALRLQHLRPDALQKEAEAEQADDAPVSDHLPYDLRGIRRHPGVRRHEKPAGRGKDKPQRRRQRRPHAREFIRLRFLSQAEPGGHGRIDAHAGPDRQSDHQKLQRVDDREGRQARLRVPAHKEAVHDIVKGLDELRQHHRRRDFEHDPGNFLLPEKLGV